MPYPLDPASLEGDELDRWYRRSPSEIEYERQAAAAQRYSAFFEGTDPDPTQSNREPGDDSQSSRIGDDGSDVLWVANGSGGYRAVRPGASVHEATLTPPRATPEGLPENPATPEDGYLIDVGNPHNPRLRREWEAANGQPWPKTDDGRNYHVAHKQAIADGGTNTLANIEPMHPDDHMAQHLNNGDAGRWGRRSSIARTFGGRVEPPTPGLRLNGLGLLGIIPDVTGVRSGRIRTDTPVHFWYDMAGVPAPGDSDQVVDPVCRSMGITKPGARCA